MKLEELMMVADENMTMVVFEDNIEAARYDGKESIPNELNDRMVLNVKVVENELHVEINF